MSRESSIQSKPIREEGGQCIPKDFEEEVCTDEAEYHYDPVNQVCSPEVVVQVEYKETKKGIKKIVKLDEQKILANRAQNFRAEPKKEAQKKVEEEEEILAVEVERHTHGVSEVNPELIGALIEQHEEAVAQPELLTGPVWDLSEHIFYQPRFNETETSSREIRRSRSQDEPEAVGCSESETVPLESSLQPLLGAALFSGDKSLRSLLAEELEVRGTKYEARIDFVVVAIQRQMVSDKSEVEPQKTPEREDLKEGPSAPVLAQSYSQTYFVFSASEISSFSNPILSSLPEQGALVFRFDSLPVADRNVSALVVLFPSLVSPRKENGRSEMGLEGNGTRAVHTRVEAGSNSQSSRDSNHSGGHGNGRDPNPREQNEVSDYL